MGEKRPRGRRGPAPAEKTPRLEIGIRPKGPQKLRYTFHLPADLVERVRDAAHWTPGLTLAGLCEEALRDAVGRLERERGEPFPPRKGELKGGRPIGS